MINTDRLRGLMAEHRLSQAEVARRLGLSYRAMYLKMKHGTFWVSEAQQLVDMLDIKDPNAIFFADKSA